MTNKKTAYNSRFAKAGVLCPPQADLCLVDPPRRTSKSPPSGSCKMLKINTNKAMIKNIIYIILINFMIISSFSSCNKQKDVNADLIYTYEAADKTLYNEIVAIDSIFWQAYNNCDMETQESIFSEDLEFYHDLNGLRTSKEVMLEAIKTKICGKITRVLVEGSIEVYPIKDFGAVQFGLHKFHKKQEPGNISKPSRYVFIWKHDDGNWKITRVISLH